MKRMTAGTIACAATLLLAAACAFETQGRDDATSPVDAAAGEDVVAEVAPEAVVEAGPDAPAGPPYPEAPMGPWVANADHEPRYLHATWSGDASSTVSIQWQTRFADTNVYKPRVWLAREDETKDAAAGGKALPFDGSHWVEGAGFSYLTWDNQGEEMNLVQWAVDVHGLVPDTRYHYRVGTWEGFDDATAAFTGANLSEVASFKTARAKGDAGAFSFVVAGDSRADEGKIAANTERLKEIDVGFWLFSGDMTEMGTQLEWFYWFDSMKPVLGRRVMMPVQGNHEMMADLYYTQFVLPGMAGLPMEYKEHGWSFDFGNTHFVGLDSNGDVPINGQIPWLTDDLAAADADPDITWKVVMFHHPAYSASTKHGSDEYVKPWCSIFEKYHVDLALAGHDHDYERSYPVRGDQKVADGEGVVYVVAGAFYAPGYTNGYDWWTVTSAHGDKGNYLVIDVDGKSFHVKAFSGDGAEVLDEFTLTK
jgi:hypothetical protein